MWSRQPTVASADNEELIKFNEVYSFWGSLQKLDLLVKETKLNLRYAHILDRFALGDEKEYD